MKAETVQGHFVERRKYPRFKPDINSWKDDPVQSLPDRGTIFSVEEHYLDDIPLFVISDKEIRCSSSTSSSILPRIKKRRIRFSGLTEKQLVKLELFLLAYVDVPKVDGEEQKKYRQIAAAENFSSIV